jgi:hypothetical protein
LRKKEKRSNEIKNGNGKQNGRKKCKAYPHVAGMSSGTKICCCLQCEKYLLFKIYLHWHFADVLGADVVVHVKNR